MKKVIKYCLIVTGWIILGIIFLLVLSGLLIQTRPVKNRLANIAEKQAGKFLNDELTIGKIDGNFFTRLALEDLLLTFEQDTVAYIAELNVSYNLLRLLNNTVDIQSVKIREPFFYLKQYKDSTWNLQKIIKSGGQKKDTAKSGGMNIVLADLTISHGNIKTEALDTVIPQKINNLTTGLSFRLAGEEMNVDVEEFKLTTVQPDFQLNQLQFELQKDAGYFELLNFYLKTAKNNMEGNAQLETEKPMKGSAGFETSEIQLNEFEYFIPKLKIPAKPVVNFEASLNGDSMHVYVTLKEDEQSVELDLKSSNLADYLFNKSEQLLNYKLDGEFNNVELGHWIGNPELNYFINGNLTASGKGIEPAGASIIVKANFNESIVEEKRFKELLVDLELDHGNLSGFVNGDGEFGWFRIEPDIKNIFEHPEYKATLETRELDLAQLLGDDSLNSNLNLTAEITGKEFDPKKLSAGAEILMSGSRFQEINIDTLVADAKYNNSNILVDSLWIRTQTTTIGVEGNYNFEGNSDIQLTAEFDGIEEFQLFLPLQGLETDGKLKAQITGTPDSLTLDAVLNLDETRYQEITLQDLRLDAEGRIAGADTIFNAQLKAHGFVTGKFALDSVSAQVEGSLDSLFIVAGVSNKDLNTTLQTGFVPGDKLRFTMNDWQIDFKNQQWSLQQPPAVFEMDSVNYKVKNFMLTSGGEDSVQTIQAEGNISRKGEEDFKLGISGVRLAELFETLEKNIDATGTLNVNFNLHGTATEPVVKGDFTLDNAAFNDYKFTDFNGQIDYADQQFGFETYIVSEDSGKVHIAAALPLQLNLDTMGYHFNPNDSIEGVAVIDSFSLGILRILELTGDINGYLEGNVDLGGTVSTPDPQGNIRLVNANIVIEEYGIDYDEIKLDLNFRKNSAVLDTFYMSSNKGSLTGEGAIDFGSEFYKGDVSQSEIQLKFDEFKLLDHDQFNMEVSGNASIGGEEGNVVFDGDLEIPQAEIYLPAVLSMMGQLNPPEMPKPILVRRAESMQVSLDSLGIKTFEAAQPDSVQFTYFENLEGQLRIKIPKNTWIKNEDMRVELSGDIELIKNKEFFELFGSVEVVRGQYDLLGRTFVINEGTISFQGGEEILPRLNIDATYTFRNRSRADQELEVQITGTPESPEVNFTLDGSSVSEGDAMSYILFGKGMNELTMSEQQNVEGAGGGSLAEAAAASVLSSQITNFLGNKLNVDFIEVKSEEGFANASVVVGKYITNDLFVSYEQRFGETDEKDVAKYEVKLEYELFRFLFFELNNSSNDSGFDIIVKFDVE